MGDQPDVKEKKKKIRLKAFIKGSAEHIVEVIEVEETNGRLRETLDLCSHSLLGFGGGFMAIRSYSLVGGHPCLLLGAHSLVAFGLGGGILDGLDGFGFAAALAMGGVAQPVAVAKYSRRMEGMICERLQRTLEWSFSKGSWMT